MAEPKVRMSLDLSPGDDKRLTELADRIGASKSELLRRALALIDFAIEAKGKGERLAVTDSDHKVLREIVVA